MNYKQFDIEAIRRGEPCKTRDGREAKFVFESVLKDDPQPFLFVYHNLDGDEMKAVWVTSKGRAFAFREDDIDIVVAPKTKTYWLNIYKHEIIQTYIVCKSLYKTEKEAIKNIKSEDYLKTISIEVEE
jgi:hypothetical protein